MILLYRGGWVGGCVGGIKLQYNKTSKSNMKYCTLNCILLLSFVLFFSTAAADVFQLSHSFLQFHSLVFSWFSRH